MITTKLLGAVSALFASTSVLFLTLWLLSSNALESLQSKHTALQIVSKECAEAKVRSDARYEDTLLIVKGQRLKLDSLTNTEQKVVTSISNYKPTCTVVNTEKGESNEVDIDAPLDPEFIRVSEGDN